MYHISDQLDRIETLLRALEYRGGQVVKDEDMNDIFDEDKFFAFRVEKDTKKVLKTIKSHPCVFAIRKRDLHTTSDSIWIYWYSYTKQSMKGAMVSNRNLLIDWLTKRDADITFKIDDDIFTLPVIPVPPIGSVEVSGTGIYTVMGRQEYVERVRSGHDPPLKMKDGRYILNNGTIELIQLYDCNKEKQCGQPIPLIKAWRKENDQRTRSPFPERQMRDSQASLNVSNATRMRANRQRTQEHTLRTLNGPGAGESLE